MFGNPGDRLSPWRDAALFLGLTVIVRAVTVPRSVIDWDESLYFLMAEQWRAGHLPYTALWDNKPLGIYALFALAQTVFGDTVAAIRLAAMLAVVSSACCLGLVMRQLAPDSAWAPRLAGALYILGASVDDGLAANTEIFMAPFTCLGFLYALRSAGAALPRRAGIAGLIMGVACMVKYVAIFDACVVYAFIITTSRRSAGGFAIATTCFALGGIMPMAAAWLPYDLSGQSDAFVAASLVSNTRRVDEVFSVSSALHALHWQLYDLAPLYAAAALLIGHSVYRRDRTPAPMLLIFWLGGSAIGIISAKSFYFHYFLQMLPPLAAASAWIACRLPPRRLTAALAFLLIWPGLAAGYMMARTARPIDWRLAGASKDVPAHIAADLGPVLGRSPGQTPLYVFDYEPILYALTRTQPPSRYAFPPFLTSPFLARVAGIDGRAEFARIIARQPRFIVTRGYGATADEDAALYDALGQELARDYQPWRRYAGGAEVYRRRP